MYMCNPNPNLLIFADSCGGFHGKMVVEKSKISGSVIAQ